VSENDNISVTYYWDDNQTTTGPIVSRGNQLHIVFQANTSDYGRGFLASYQAGNLLLNYVEISSRGKVLFCYSL